MLYIIIPVHNRIQTTLSCLDALAHQITAQPYKVIVVDDGSTDKTTDLIHQSYPQTIILAGDGNLWWTGAISKAIEHVLIEATTADDIISLNNDVTFKSDYLTQLYEASRANQRAIVGSLCLDSKNKKTVIDAGVKINWRSYKFYQQPYLSDPTAVVSVDTISGRGVLIPVPVVKQIGNFNAKRFPHYGADYEYGFRAKAAGIPLVLAYRAIVYLDTTTTGLHFSRQEILSYSDAWRRLFSIKSPSNLKVQLALIYTHCPTVLFTIRNLAYVLLGNLYIFLRNCLLYTVSIISSRRAV